MPLTSIERAQEQELHRNQPACGPPFVESTGWRRAATGVALSAFLTLVLLVALTWHLFVFPRSTVPARADAIIVLAGGEGERLRRAVELMNEGVAATLVVSAGGDDWTPADAKRAVDELCATRTSFQLICQTSSPDSTRGEGATFSRLASENDWKIVLVVTSDYHLLRSVTWFNRCFAGRVYGAAASSRLAPKLILHEWLGVIAQATIQRSCLSEPARARPT